MEQTTARISAGQQIGEDDLVGQLVTGWTDWSQQTTWPVFADSVAATYHALPPEIRPDTVIVTNEYATAAALEVLGPARGLPEHVYSYSVGFGYLHTPPAEATVFLFVGWNDGLGELFAEVHPMGVVEGNAGELTGTPLVLGNGPHVPLADVWAQLRYP